MARKTTTIKHVQINLSQCEYEVLEDVADALNLSVSSSPEADVFWQDGHLTTEELATFKSFQRVNHFPGMYSIARKDHLARGLKLMKAAFPKDYAFFPRSWVLPKDLMDLQAQFNSKRAKTFIVKPEASSQGRGIFLTRRLEDLPQNCVVQRYLHKPFLLDGFKFDLRVYVLITGCDPLRLFVHEEGLVRLATEQYHPPLPSNLSNLYMHLTNYAVNKNHPDYCINSDFSGHKRSLKQFMAWLSDRGYDAGKLWSEIGDIAVKTVCLVQPVLTHLYRASQPSDLGNQICFQIIGLDIFLDASLKPYVLEVNHTPSFGTDSALDQSVKFAVISDTLRMLGLSSNYRANQYPGSQLINRATKGVKEMRNYRTQVRAQIAEKRTKDENDNLGGYHRIYPSEHSEEYQQFMETSRELWLNSAYNKTKVRSKTEKIKFSASETLKEKKSGREQTKDNATSRNTAQDKKFKREKTQDIDKKASPYFIKRRQSTVIISSKSARGIVEMSEYAKDPVRGRTPGSYVKPKIYLFGR